MCSGLGSARIGDFLGRGMPGSRVLSLGQSRDGCSPGLEEEDD